MQPPACQAVCDVVGSQAVIPLHRMGGRGRTLISLQERLELSPLRTSGSVQSRAYSAHVDVF